MPITAKQVRDASWSKTYGYESKTLYLLVFTAPTIPGVALTHARKRGDRRTRIEYSVGGHRTDSVFALVRLFNEHERKSKLGATR